jgi:ABC-2 type transport system permease protein
MMGLLRSALVIGRRDFTATVLSRTFIFFLLGPVFPLIFGLVFGSIGAHVAGKAAPPVIAVAASKQDFAALTAARDQLEEAGVGSQLAELRRIDPKADGSAQLKLLQSPDSDVVAVLSGGLDHPQLTGDVDQDGSIAAQVRLIIRAARAKDVPLAVVSIEQPIAAKGEARTKTGQAAQTLLFFLTLLLAGMTLSQLIEEKSNKVIEILAAAVPIEAVFLGKLFAMLLTSLVGIAVWASAGAAAIAAFTGGFASLPPPAVGWPAFVLLAVIYFAMNYLVLGSVFLAIGAQASTAREVQTMSMPVTMTQLLIFGLAALAVGSPNSPVAIAGAAFPLSSSLVMVARAAELPQLWPHLLALAWDLLWVALIVRFAAGWFRRTVLKSGPRRKAFWRKTAEVAAEIPISG